MVPDFRKTLPVLHSEWQDCRKCFLGELAESRGGQYVRGEGALGGIMFVGEGPGTHEEEDGRPFVGASGEILRSVIEKYNVSTFYLTNVVAHRSCEARRDPQGNLLLNRLGDVQFEDVTPTIEQVTACLPRLQEEIYLVDPVIIVTLGGRAAETLKGKAVSITKERGKPVIISIPGNQTRPVLTDKKREWARKLHGQIHRPVEQNTIQYLMLPTLHPAYVARQLADQGPRSPFTLFAKDIRMANHVYQRYLLEAYGTAPAAVPDLENT